MSKNFISLADVKINNSYDYIRTVAPTVAEKAPVYSAGETWLNTDTGYSYELTNATLGTWTRIEIDIDNKILLIGPDVFNTVIRYLNNYFVSLRVLDYFENYETSWPSYFDRERAWIVSKFECVFSEATFTASNDRITMGDDVYGSLTATFAEGDTLFISGTRRNNGYYTIDDVTDEYITVVEDIQNESAPSFLFFSSVPAALISIVARMVWYDLYKRAIGAGLKSERIGTYSYTREDTTGSALNYPNDILG